MRLPGGVELHTIENGAGAPLVFLHGGTGDYASWAPQMQAFSTFFRTIAYSRRHHHPNRNGKPHADHSALVEAGDLAGLLEHLEIERAHLVGTSYGAFTALVFALRRPDKVASLVLAEPPAHGLAAGVAGGRALLDRFLSDVWRPAGAAFALGAPERALGILADGMWGRPVFARVRGARRAIMLRNAGAMRALVASSDPFPHVPRRDLAQLHVPVLLVAGEHATPLHKLVNRELARALPAAREIAIPRASHGSPHENPGGFNAALYEFYASLAAPSSS